VCCLCLLRPATEVLCVLTVFVKARNRSAVCVAFCLLRPATEVLCVLPVFVKASIRSVVCVACVC